MPVFFGKFTDQNTKGFFFLKKNKCAPRGWKQRKTFPNAKMDSDVLYDLIKKQSLKHWLAWMWKRTLCLSVCVATKPYIWVSAWNVLWLILHEFLIILICILWKWFGHSLLSESLAKQISQHTLCPTICRTFEPNINFLP